MSENLEHMASVIAVIQDDAKLRECFLRLLKFGSSTQQVRVATLEAELDRLGAPDEVVKFVNLLANDQLAHQVFKLLSTEIQG